jgi:hypothetical protein
LKKIQQSYYTLYSFMQGCITAKYVNIKVVSSENGVWVGEIFCLVWYSSLFRQDFMTLKGQCHEIFDPQFFSSKHPSWAPD